ncbi:MAG: hypothetical protein AAGA45_02255, partial [Verrucomicrobiota bacterium]
IFLVAALLLGLLTAPWWARPLAADLLQGALEEYGFDNVTLRVTHLGLSRLVVEDVSASYARHSFTLQNLEAFYEPAQLLGGRIDSLYLSGLDAVLDFTPDIPATSKVPPTTQAISLPQALPLRQLVLTEATVRPRWGQESLDWQVEAQLLGRTQTQATFTAINGMTTIQGEMRLDLPTGNGEGTLGLQASQLAGTLTPYLPWIEPALQSHRVSASLLELDAAFSLEALQATDWVVMFAGSDLALALEARELVLEQLEAGASGRSRELTAAWLSSTTGNFTDADSTLGWERLTLELRDGERLDLIMDAPSYSYADLSAALPEGTLSAAIVGPLLTTSEAATWRYQAKLPPTPVQATWQEAQAAGDLRFDAEGESTGGHHTIGASALLSQFVYADVDFSDVQLQADYSADAATASLDFRAEAEALGGNIKARALSRLQPSFHTDVVLILDGISASDTVAYVPDFPGQLSGQLTGKIQASANQDQLLLHQGTINLEPGTPASLQLDPETRLLSGQTLQQLQTKTDGKRIDELFQLPGGETLVSELALRDLTLTSGYLTLQPVVDIDAPRILIHLEGSSTVAGAEVPIVLDIPIRIDLESALRDWARLQALGP